MDRWPVLRNLFAASMGFSAALATWVAFFMSHLMFIRQAPLVLIPPIVAGLLGGCIAALCSPKYKVRIASAVGLIMTGLMLVWMLPHGFNPAADNPLVWYWPVCFLPAFIMGGCIVRSVPQSAVDKAAEHD